MRISHRLLYVWRRNFLSYKRFIIPTLLVSMGEPLFYLVAFGLGLGAYMGLLGGQTYLSFLVPGVFITSVMMSSTFECLYGSYIRMVYEKLYDPIIATPVLAEDAIAGDILWGTFRGLIAGAIMLIVAAFLGVYPASLFGFVVIVILAAAVGLLFSSLSLIVSSYAPNFDFFNYYSELFIMPMFIFSGVFFPLDKMPEVVKIIGNFLPLFHAVKISRAAFSGTMSYDLIYSFLIIVVLFLIASSIALKTMKRRLIK